MKAANRGKQIAAKSFSIIRGRLGDFHPPERILEIMIRITHASGDVDFGKSFEVPMDALSRGIEAMKCGCPIIADVEMVRSGIRKRLSDKLGCEISCFLNDPGVIEKSKETGETRSALGMERAGKLLNGAVVAIGNAPTALFRLLDMIRDNEVKPALTVGVPVGFVGAYESKQALFDSGYPGITNLSERGGSTIAAAIVNGILHIASNSQHEP